MLVIQPSFAAVGWPAVLPLCVAVIFALFMLITRQIAKQTDPIGLQAVSGVMACAVLAPLLLWGQSTDLPPLQILALRPQEWALLILIGTVGGGLLGQPSIGLLVGLALGIIIALLIYLGERGK